MIASLHGTLESLTADRARILAGPVGYEVLLPGFAYARLGGSIGQPVTLQTFCFFESHNQGATLLPRLAGFLTETDRRFFELFVTCKGIGYRKGLRALSLPSAQIAAAIADRDVATLQSLPEIGKRTAETLVVTLRDKVEPFLGEPAATGSAAPAKGSSVGPGRSLAREALEVLVQLGENRAQAQAWVDQALETDDPPREVQALLAAVYRLRAGA